VCTGRFFQASDLRSSEEKVTNHIKSIKCKNTRNRHLFPSKNLDVNNDCEAYTMCKGIMFFRTLL